MKKIAIIIAVCLVPSLVSAATLSLSPSSQSVNVGDTFTVNVNLDTQNASIDGVDLRYLNYNPSILQLQDSNTSSSGVQIAPGTLMPMTLANSADTGLGRVTFSQVALGGSKYKGSGTLATLTFKALSSGTANLSFNYTSGVTTDSNIAAAGSDVLTAVVNGSYTVNGSSSGNTNTNTNTGSSSSSSGGGGGGGGSVSSGYGGSATSPVATTVVGGQLSRNLSQGASGDDVRVLQNFLVSKGYLTADNVTGFFGPSTELAVKSFQAANGIISSGDPISTGYGAIGPTTRAKINTMLSGSTGFAQATSVQVSTSGSLTRNLSYGAQGNDVKILQNFLVSRGHLTADNVTGFFGALTQAAVKAFQAANGIVSSGSPETTGYGNVGPSTRGRINASLGSSTVSSPSTQNSQALQAQVDALQKQLNELLLKLQKAQ